MKQLIKDNFQIYKQLMQYRKICHPIKSGKDLDISQRKDIKSLSKHMKKLILSHANQNYGYHLTPNGHHQKSTNNKCWKKIVRRKGLLLLLWDCKWIRTGKWLWNSLKTRNKTRHVFVFPLFLDLPLRRQNWKTAYVWLFLTALWRTWK